MQLFLLNSQLVAVIQAETNLTAGLLRAIAFTMNPNSKLVCPFKNKTYLAVDVSHVVMVKNQSHMYDWSLFLKSIENEKMPE